MLRTDGRLLRMASCTGSDDLASIVLDEAGLDVLSCSPDSTVLACSPAARAAGLRQGDRIIAADGVALAGSRLEAVLSPESSSHRVLVVRRAYTEENLVACFRRWVDAATAAAARLRQPTSARKGTSSS